MDNNKDLIISPKPKSELIKSVSVKSLDRFEEDIERAITKSEAEPLQKIKGPLNGMEFVLIPGGSFMMGSEDYSEDYDDEQLVNSLVNSFISGKSEDYPEDYDDEQPIHTVNIKSFYMMTTEVTQAQWTAVMGNNPSYYKGDNLPVARVSWNDVQEFLKKLNQRDPGKNYRLPSEAEWEYTCRAGTTTKYYSGDNETDLARIGWYSGNSGDKTHPVGQKIPNALGLYDMSGNVWEWCQDWYHDSYKGAPTDGSAWEYPVGDYRVLRGGSWFNGPNLCRSSGRGNSPPGHGGLYCGFRLVRSL